MVRLCERSDLQYYPTIRFLFVNCDFTIVIYTYILIPLSLYLFVSAVRWRIMPSKLDSIPNSMCSSIYFEYLAKIWPGHPEKLIYVWFDQVISADFFSTFNYVLCTSVQHER